MNQLSRRSVRHVPRVRIPLSPPDLPTGLMPEPDSRTATEIAEAAGIDMSLIRENLALSYEQRVIQHQAALELMLEMERAGQKLPDATRSADPTTLRR